MDWEAVSRASHDPRGIPVPLSRTGATSQSVVAEARRVRNAAPLGANVARAAP